MPSGPKVYATFTVTSVRPQTSGTIRTHELQYNIRAKNGTWNVYRLIDKRNNEVSAWYVSHSCVEPVRDIRKILRISGSPYEQDSGSTINTDDTQREGIFVINRYDWGCYDRRYLDEIGEGAGEGPNDVLANSNSAGLVDYSRAQLQVQQWKRMRPSERPGSRAGIWMYSPHAEYMFCRFSFDEARDATQSLVFFSSNTEFARVTFEELEETVKRFETSQERFERQLKEEYDFSGLEELRRMSTPLVVGLSPLGPLRPVSELQGPYKDVNVVFEDRDIERLRIMSQKYPKTFAEQWEHHIHNLLNELAWYYLDWCIRPHIGLYGGVEATANAMFPRHLESGANGLDNYLYRHFTQPDADPVSGLDADGVSDRIKDLLAPEPLSPPSSDYSKSVCRVLAYLIMEIFELASYRASESSHLQIVPSDIRLSVYTDRDLFRIFQYSRAFWQGVE
ncbi:hypothetical protein TWF192_000712 [Orbilia oligospora]|uniref:Uncharacterized protein n=2 Tax=Orbilia oligospora TaxID=2813651 RepID=A0A6G1LWV9_ORBOL|nr:hypothetical protein TWF679_001769 [Orbilia oligospora]KAF3235465.1 hypothetical protein TWF192_000712 [Orbilia oligospora]